MVKYMKAILSPLKLYSVAVRVFFPDTDLRLPQFFFKYDIECLVSWLRLSEIWPHLTLQVAALMLSSRCFEFYIITYSCLNVRFSDLVLKFETLQVLIYPAIQAINFRNPSFQAAVTGPILSPMDVGKFVSLYHTGTDKYAETLINNLHTSPATKRKVIAIIARVVWDPSCSIIVFHCIMLLSKKKNPGVYIIP